MGRLKGNPSDRRPAWLQRLFPSGLNLITWAAYVIVISALVVFIISPGVPIGTRYYTVIALLTGLFLLNVFWDDLRDLLGSEDAGNWMLIAVSTLVTFSAIWLGRMISGIYIIFMLCSQANMMLRPRPALAYTLLAASSMVGMSALLGVSSDGLIDISVGLLIGLTFTVTLSQVLRLYSDQTQRANTLLRQLQEANAALLEARQKERELALAEERLRLAREIHDGLGHHLTALSIQLQAAEKLVKSNPDAAAGAVHASRGEVQAALKEVRQSVAALRETPVDIQDLPNTLASLAREFGALAGLHTHFEERGQPFPLSPAAAMTLYRAAQEGLTNARKHAVSPEHVEIALEWQERQVSLSIRDDGRGQADCSPAQGFGLAGISERAALLGGKMGCGPLPGGGFRLEISLPASAERKDA